MHIQTHCLTGWNIANLLPLGKRERFFAMLVSILPDLDGLTILFGEEAYQDYHHVLSHNLPVLSIFALVPACFSKPRFGCFVFYILILHLHLLMDYYGSGEGWSISYLWPFNSHEFMTGYGWEFYSWQNLTFGGLMVIWMMTIVYRKKRTPLEYIMPGLDRQLVNLIYRWINKLFSFFVKIIKA